MEFAEPGPLRRDELLEEGFTRSSINRRVTSRRWQRLHRSIYLEVDAEHDPEAQWRARMRGHLWRGGPDAAVSHRAAARLHGLDGDWGDHEDLEVPFSSTFRRRPAVRSRTLGPSDITVVDGLAVTTVGRTLAELGRFVSLAALELAVESGLRGEDPRRPHEWKTAVLDDLYQRATGSLRRPGVSHLRRVLARRPPNARPTGSAAETRLVQALRPVGLSGLERQPLVRFVSGTGIRDLYPDFADLRRGLLIEVDGVDAHGSAAALERDLPRQNLLADVFLLKRFTGTRIRREGASVASEIRAWYDRSPDRGTVWTHREATVVLRPYGCEVRVA